MAAIVPTDVSTPRSVLDVNGLDALKSAATNDPQATLKQVARDFSSLFIDEMLQSMRDAGFQSSLTSNKGTRLYQSLLDQQVSQNVAGHGIGLAKMLVAALRARGAGTGATAIPIASPKPLEGKPVAPASATLSHQQQPRDAGTPERPEKEESDVDATTPMSTSSPASDTPAQRITSFVHRFIGEAESVANKIGVSAKLVLAQAALETGWGAHPSGGKDGSGHNLFGIKAGDSGAPSAIGNTTEYQAGMPIATTAAFRSYASDAGSFADYARLIGTDPRYAAVRSAATPQQAAWALQDAGYATDPAYATKLIRVMREINKVPAGRRTTSPQPTALVDVTDGTRRTGTSA